MKDLIRLTGRIVGWTIYATIVELFAKFVLHLDDPLASTAWVLAIGALATREPRKSA